MIHNTNLAVWSGLIEDKLYTTDIYHAIAQIPPNL